MRLLSESGLSRRIVAGDRRAYAELFRRYRQPLYGYCVSIVGNQDDAADALQNTMARALQSLPGESRDLNLKPWLFRVAHNQCVDLMRARRGMDDIDDHELPSTLGVERTVAAREGLAQVISDLDKLPERQRGALVMRELNGLSFDEIATAIDSTPAAAKQVVYEARCALQEQARGREMDCESVRSAISERDGRVLRGRRIRAHLRACEGCADFKAGITTRRADLRALIPPIPAALALSIVETFGGPGAGGGLAGILGAGGGGKAVLSGGAMKAVAVVAVTTGVGAGTLGVVEGTRQGDEPADPPARISTGDALPVLPLTKGESAAGSVRTDSGSRSDRKGTVDQRKDRTVGDGKDGSFSGSGKHKGGTSVGAPGTPGVPLAEVTPGPPVKHPGGTGGAQGKGAVPSHGGRPTELPAASGHGQEQAAAHANPSSAVVNPGKASKPVDPGASGVAKGKSAESK